MKRREFIKAASATVLSTGALARETAPTERLAGVQIAPFSILDEGIDRCLETLKDKAAINALFIYSQSYYPGYNKPPNVMATDHGVTVRDMRKRKLPALWVRHRDHAFADQIVGHQRVNSDFEYGDRDIFSEIREPATKRGMKVYARILEADGRRGKLIPGYEKVLTVDHEGKPGHGPCWNNPDYREWVYTTIRELVTNYELDGLQYGAERTGPLSHVLFRGLTPTCFCQHCTERNKQRGIDAGRAKEGFAKLYGLMKAGAGRSAVSSRAAAGSQKSSKRTADGALSSAMRILYQHPEVLSWDYQWFQADEEICAEVHRIAKELRPQIDSGRHVDHQRSSWDFFYRSAMSYEQMAENADFIKPIVYHDPMGPRLRWWVLDRMKDLVLSDLSLEQSLQLFYGVFGHDASKQPSLDELDKAGLGPEYVYREIRRCKTSVGKSAKVYAGIGIDVPWYVPNGMEPRPSDREKLIAAVHRAFDAGADGVLASREYDEMRIPSLEAFGKAVRTSAR